MEYFLYNEMHPVKGAKPCPICGTDDGVYINNAKHFNSLIKEHGRACLVMGCKRCELSLYEFDHAVGSKKYADVKKALIEKWNNRRENAK